MNRQLINYLPEYVREYEEIKAIMQAEQVAIAGYWDNIDIVENNQFILKLTAHGCERWEKMLDVQPMADDTLDERRFRILALLNAQLPFTLRQLKNMLTTVCGAGGFAVVLYPNEYAIIIKLALTNEKNYKTVENLLKTIIPANLAYKIYMFNTHKMLHRLTHGQMRKFVHYGLRTDVIDFDNP